MSENKKFRLTDETMTMEDGTEVFQIEAIEAIPSRNVKVGDLGGFIESEDNLSFEDGDLAWVQRGGYVYGDSEVKNNSIVSKRTEIKNSVIDDSTVYKDVEVNNSEVTSSYVSHGAKINDSKVLGSTLHCDHINKSNVEYCDTHLSNVTNSTLKGVLGSCNVVDSHLDNLDFRFSELEQEEYVGIHMVNGEMVDSVNLTDADLADLNDLENDVNNSPLRV